MIQKKLKSALFGYSRRSVSEYIDELNRDFSNQIRLKELSYQEQIRKLQKSSGISVSDMKSGSDDK